jgi:hypothetical protein
MRANFRPDAVNYSQVIRASRRQRRGVADAVVLSRSLDERWSASVSRQCRYSSLFVDGTGLAGGSTSY